MVTAPHAAPRPARFAKAPFSDAVLLCGKCSRKLGKDGKDLRRSLKRALKRGRWGRVKLIETRCFSLCPKRRLVLASAASLAVRRLVVAEPDSSIDEMLRLLLGPPTLGAREAAEGGPS